MLDNAKLLLRVYSRPSAAMSAILDEGSLLFASIAVAILGWIFRLPPALARFSFSFYTPLLVLAAFYVPGLILLSKPLAGLAGSTGGNFQRDYSPLLACTAVAWTAANIPLAILGRALPPAAFWGLAAATYLYFAFLMLFAIRTVFGIDNRIAIAIVSLSWIPLIAVVFLWGPLHFILGWLASPFFLFYAYYFLGSEIGNIGAGFRARQHFHRMLQASAINPHDAEAQYQLGLIYQRRRQYAEAISHFTKATEIDREEIDAHFQLGKIAREQGRLKDALGHFETVLNLDPRHAQHEVLRELGGVYLTAKQYADARTQLAEYIHHREYDPQGLFYYAQALEGLGDTANAKAAYARTIEAVRTGPKYLRRTNARWSRQAQKRL